MQRLPLSRMQLVVQGLAALISSSCDVACCAPTVLHVVLQSFFEAALMACCMHTGSHVALQSLVSSACDSSMLCLCTVTFAAAAIPNSPRHLADCQGALHPDQLCPFTAAGVQNQCVSLEQAWACCSPDSSLLEGGVK